MNLFSLLGRVKVNTADFDGAMNRTDAGLLGVGRTAKTLTSLLGAAGLAGGLTMLARSALDTAQKFESLDISLRTALAQQAMATGQASNLRDAMGMVNEEFEQYSQWILEVAKVSPFERADVQAVFEQTMFGGATAEQAQRMTQAMLDFATATGKGGETLDRIGYAIQQVMTSGQLLGQDLRQLTNAGINMWQALAEYYGMTVEEVRKFQEEGMVSSQDAMEAMARYLEKYYSGATEVAAETTQGLRSTFAELKELAFKELTEPLAEGLRGWLKELIDLLESPQIEGALQTLGGGLAQLVELLGAPISFAVNALKGLADLITKLNPEFVKTAMTAGGLATAFIMVTPAIAALLPILAGLISPTTLLIAGIAGLATLVITFKDELIGLAQVGGQAISKLGQRIGESLVGAVEWAVDQVLTGINWMVENVITGINWLLDKLNRIPGVNIAPIEWTPLSVDWEAVEQKVQQGVEDITTWTKGATQDVGNFLSGVWGDVSTFIEGAAGDIGDKLKDLFYAPESMLAEQAADQRIQARLQQVGMETSGSFVDGFTTNLKTQGSREADKALKDFMSRVQSAVGRAMGASQGLLDLTVDWIQPGANGPFENLYRALAVAKDPHSQWAQVLGLSQEDALRIMQDFQRGLMSPEVIGLIDIPMLVDKIRQETQAEASQEEFAQMIADMAGVGVSKVKKALGMPGGEEDTGKQMGEAIQTGLLAGYAAESTVTQIISATEKAIDAKKDSLKETGKSIAGLVATGVREGAPGLVDALLSALMPGIISSLNWQKLQNGNAGYVP